MTETSNGSSMLLIFSVTANRVRLPHAREQRATIIFGEGRNIVAVSAKPVDFRERRIVSEPLLYVVCVPARERFSKPLFMLLSHIQKENGFSCAVNHSEHLDGGDTRATQNEMM